MDEQKNNQPQVISPQQTVQPAPAAPASSNPSGELNAPAAMPSAQPPKKSSKKMLLVALVLVVVVLVAGYFLLVKKDKKAATPAPAVPTVKAATTADIDQTNKDLDGSIQQADSAKDVSSTDLTDTALGL